MHISDSGLSLRVRRGSAEAGKPQELDRSVLTYKGHVWPREMFQFIVQEIGVPRDRISHVAEASQVMSLNISSNLQPKLEYFVGELGIPRKTLGRVIGSFPQLLTLNLQANLIPKLRFLSEELGVAEKDVGKVITRHPQLLGLSLEDNIRPTAEFLLEEARVPIDKLPNLILRYPSVLSLSIDGNLIPTVEYLRDNLGMDAAGLGRAIGINPMLLTLSLEKTMIQTVSFYKTELRIPKSTLAEMARRYPPLLTFNIENNVKPKIELLVKGMDLSLSKATRIIIAYPSVLGRSKYSLLSSYNGLLSAGFRRKEASRMLVAQPRLLIYGCRDSAQEVVAALQAPPLLFAAGKARKLVGRYPALLTMRHGAGERLCTAPFVQIVYWIDREKIGQGLRLALKILSLIEPELTGCTKCYTLHPQR